MQTNTTTEPIIHWDRGEMTEGEARKARQAERRQGRRQARRDKLAEQQAEQAIGIAAAKRHKMTGVID